MTPMVNINKDFEMLAYHNDHSIKAAIIAELRVHAADDDFIKGKYWEDGKGCAVGWTVKSGDHMEYESRFGIPVMLAKLEDRIFEGLPNDDAKAWPIQFMDAIAVGSDLSCVGWQFQHWLLTDSTVNPGIDHPLVRDAIKECANVLYPLTKGERVDGNEAWSAGRRAAESAESAKSAESAALNAGWSARSARWSARSAALNAESAPWSAAWNAAWSADSAAWSASLSAGRSAAYKLMALKLIELIQAAS
jgi:hypothetical protein